MIADESCRLLKATTTTAPARAGLFFLSGKFEKDVWCSPDGG